VEVGRRKKTEERRKKMEPIEGNSADLVLRNRKVVRTVDQNNNNDEAEEEAIGDLAERRAQREAALARMEEEKKEILNVNTSSFYAPQQAREPDEKKIKRMREALSELPYEAMKRAEESTSPAT